MYQLKFLKLTTLKFHYGNIKGYKEPDYNAGNPGCRHLDYAENSRGVHRHNAFRLWWHRKFPGRHWHNIDAGHCILDYNPDYSVFRKALGREETTGETGRIPVTETATKTAAAISTKISTPVKAAIQVNKMLYASNTFVSYNYPLKEADVAFLGIPFASTSISAGSIYGPLMVRESLKLMEDYIPEKNENLFGRMKVCDLGDIEIVPGSFELTAKRIRETIGDIKAENKKAFVICIGGEHSITLPIAEAMKPKTIIQLDAHSDTRKDYLGAHSHQAWAYHASKFSKILQIGVRTWNKEEMDFVKSGGASALSVEEFMKSRIKIERPVHLSIDMDVFSPAFVETGLPEGSLTPEEVFGVLKKIPCDSMDITEIADNKLPSKTGFLAAEMIKMVLAKRIK